MNSQQSAEKQNVWTNRFLSLGVFVTCFLGMALSSGATSAMSVLVVEFLEYFHQSRFLTSWCSGITSTLNFATAPLWMLALHKMSHRRVLAAGVVFSTVGLFTSSFTTSIYQLYVTLGLITGLGYGMFGYISLVYAGEYFTNRRYLAMGFVSAGSGVGNMLIPLLLNVFIEAYTWRGALMILAAITFQLAALSFFIRRINDTDKTQNKSDIGDVGMRNCKDINFENKNINNSSAMCSEILYSEEVTLQSQRKTSLSETGQEDSILIFDNTIDTTTDSYLYVAEVAIENRVDRSKLLTPKHNLITLLKTWQLYLFALTQLTSNFCISLFLTFNMDYFLSVGMRRADGISLVFLVGIGSVCGRLGTGFLAHYFDKRRTTFLLATNLFFAVSMILIATYKDLYLYSVLSFVIGLSVGSIAACSPIVALELFGAARVREGLAIILLAISVGTLTGPSIGGLVYDLTQDYRVVFTMCMGVSLLAAASILPVICVTLPCIE